MFADVIFPAPSAAYVACFFIPLSAILALATEFAVYVRFQRGVISLWWLFGIVFGVNIFRGSSAYFCPSFCLPFWFRSLSVIARIVSRRSNQGHIGT
jgi:hypothetical protein